MLKKIIITVAIIGTVYAWFAFSAMDMVNDVKDLSSKRLDQIEQIR